LHDGLRRDTRFITDFATVQPGAERRSSLGRSAAGRAPGHLTDRRRLLALDVAQALGVLVPGDRPLPLSLRAPVSVSGTWPTRSWASMANAWRAGCSAPLRWLQR